MSCCPNKPFWRQAIDYSRAVLRWIRNGKPTRTPEEIKERFEICRQCENFLPLAGKPWRGRCRKCGCYLGRHAHRLLKGNKIAMKTEKCPLNKWS